MRSLFLIVLLNFLFFYCLPSFAQSISCSEFFWGTARCSDGISIHKNWGGGYSIDKPKGHTYVPHRPRHRELTENDISICLAEKENPEDFSVCLLEITTKPANVPNVTCKQNSKNNTECFDKVTGRKWEIVP